MEPSSPTDHTDWAFESVAVGVGDAAHAGTTRDVVTPVHLSTSYHLDTPGYPETGHDYGRLGNPTRDSLERRLAALTGGTDVVATASGTAAIAAVCLTCLDPGDHVVAGDSLYGGTRHILDSYTEQFGIEVTYVDATDAAAVGEALRPETALVWVESPTNPLLRLCDIAAVHDHVDDVTDGTATLVVDNTFATPYAQRPLALGADVSVLSTTKFLNGHTDSIGGAVAATDPRLGDRLRHTSEEFLGAPMPPFDAYLVLRGLKTLAARMEAHERTARSVAEFLADHDAVSTVNYPGLDSHPQRALADRQMANSGGMVSFELAADGPETQAFLERLVVCNLAMSLGGVETLAEQPATMSAASLSPAQRADAGISDSLVRLSVGLESATDLVTDLERGLDEVGSADRTR
jgi:cystathionine gamma-lyase